MTFIIIMGGRSLVTNAGSKKLQILGHPVVNSLFWVKKRLNYPNGPPLHNFHHDAVRSKCILQLHQRSLNRLFCRWIDGVRYLWKRPVVKKWHPKKIICLPRSLLALWYILNRKIDIKVEDLHKNKESSAAAAIFCEVLRLKSQINDVRGSWG